MNRRDSFLEIDKKDDSIKLLIELKREPFYNLLREFFIVIILLLWIWFLKDSIYIFYYLYFLIFFNRLYYFIIWYYFYKFSRIIKITKIWKKKKDQYIF